MITKLTIYNLTCNYTENPIGIEKTPRLCWKISSDKTGDLQKSYKIYIAESLDAMAAGSYCFESDSCRSDEQFYCCENKFSFQARTRYFWRVEIQNSDDKIFISDIAFFETGKMNEQWSAYWIGAPFITKEIQSHGAPYLRKSIKCEKEIASARLYISGLGYYEPYINGTKVSAAMLEPAFTKYDKRVFYSVYDVLPFIDRNEFALGIVLGNGWYNYFELDEWNFRCAPWKGMPRAIAELHLVFADGTCETVITDESWKAHPSPIVYNCLRNGETYDATKEIGDWSGATYNDSDWENAIVMRSPGGLLIANEIEQIKITEELPTVSLWNTSKGSWVFDFGQNMAGVARLSVRGKKGTVITMVYGEALSQEDRTVDNSHNDGFVKSGDFQTARYIIGEDDRPEEWTPAFSYYGFRYVELSGDIEVSAKTLTACVMHSSFGRIGHFNCSDETLNTIQRMCNWSTLSNSYGLHTDCPHREKNSWTGDSTIVSEQMMINFDTIKFFDKWCEDLYDAQRPDGAIPCIVPSPGWGYNWGNGPDYSKAIAEVPWNLYLHTGDKRFLEKAYPYMKKCFDSMVSMGNGYIVDYGIGDWCAPFEGAALSVNMGSFKASRSLIDTTSLYIVATILSRCEELLGYQDEHREIACAIKKVIRERFIDDDMVVEGDCQTSYAFALFFDLADDNDTMLKKLLSSIEATNRHIDYGILGSKYVLQGLGEHHRSDIIYDMITQKSYPGYGNVIEMGRTTLAECWNGTGSHNHNMFSDVSAVLYKYIAGIRVDKEFPGYKRFIVSPQIFNKLNSVECEIDSPFGKIALRWKKTENSVAINLLVPFGTTAMLRLPDCLSDEAKLSQDLPCGDYTFTFNIQNQ